MKTNKNLLSSKLLNKLCKNGKKNTTIKILKEVKKNLYGKKTVFYTELESFHLRSIIPFILLKRRKAANINFVPIKTAFSKTVFRGISMLLKKYNKKASISKSLFYNLMSVKNNSGNFYLNIKGKLIFGLQNRKKMF